jgi:hypothetical protein
MLLDADFIFYRLNPIRHGEMTFHVRHFAQLEK